MFNWDTRDLFVPEQAQGGWGELNPPIPDSRRGWDERTPVLRNRTMSDLPQEAIRNAVPENWDGSVIRSKLASDLPYEILRAPEPGEKAWYREQFRPRVGDAESFEPDLRPIPLEQVLDFFDPSGGVGGIVRLTGEGKRILKAGSPYEKLIEYLHQLPNEHFIHKVPEKSTDPLVSVGRFLPDPPGEVMKSATTGYYMSPDQLYLRGLSDKLSRAGDFIAIKGFNNQDTLKHENLHRTMSLIRGEEAAQAGNRERSDLAGGLRDKIFERYDEVPIPVAYWPNSKVVEASFPKTQETMKASINKFSDSFLSEALDPDSSLKARNIMRTLYPRVSPRMLNEEVIARGSGTEIPWEKLFELFYGPQGAGYAKNIHQSTWSRPVIRDILRVSDEGTRGINLSPFWSSAWDR